MNEQFPERKRFEISGKTQTFGVDYSLAACLCYIPLIPINLVAALIWLITEPKASLYVRFHAIQSLMVFGGLIAANIVVQIINFLHVIPIIGGIFSVVSGIVWFAFAAVWFIMTIMMTIKSKNGEMYKLPYIGDIAENIASS
jgi:uncharacterized membrane protein